MSTFMILHIPGGGTVCLYSCSFPQRHLINLQLRTCVHHFPQFHTSLISNRRHWVSLSSLEPSGFAIASKTLLKSLSSISLPTPAPVCDQLHCRGGLVVDKWDEGQNGPYTGIGIQTICVKFFYKIMHCSFFKNQLIIIWTLLFLLSPKKFPLFVFKYFYWDADATLGVCLM